jgi:histidinol phosphatase-like PHP family hydrolase
LIEDGAVDRPDDGTLTNADLAELFALAGENEEGHRARALRRASRAAMQWPEEAASVAERGGLTKLRAVGPWVARIIETWLEDPPDVPAPPRSRRGFLTTAQVGALVDGHPEWRDVFASDLQMHTTWSDGRASLEVMADRASAEGRRCVAVTDHSQGLPIARGMDEPTLLRQGEEIDDLNRRLRAAGKDPVLLRSIEMNLTPDGEGDMDPEVLAGLDLVLGAFHSHLRVTDDQTDRYLAAVRNPTVHVLAHPQGRRWNARDGLQADWPRVFDAAAEAGTAVEIDAFPDRQDLDVSLVEVARETGVWISIGTDAHVPDELANLRFGVATAIAGRFPRDRILNTLTPDRIRAWARDGKG